MARLFQLLAFCALLVNVMSEEDCVCLEYTEDEKKEIWDFLSQATDDGILPGLLSPIVPCGNCLDRKKRTVLPPVREPHPIDSEEDVIIPITDSRCPIGYGRIAFRCINLADLYKKK